MARHASMAMGRLLTPFILGFGLNRWPIRPERKKFRGNLANPEIRMPPLFRGLLAVPGTRAWLRDAATYAWHEQRGSLDPGGAPDLGGNLYTAWTGPGVSFLHFEKCGGIAAVHWLSRQFHPEQINRDLWRDLPPNFFTRAPPGLADDTARYPFVWGHYDLPSLRRMAPQHFVFTLLREPRARLLSLYKFWRSVEPAQADLDISFSVALAHRLSLEDFLNCDDPMLVDLIDNLYTRRLTGAYATGAAEDPLHAAPDRAFNTATRVLDSLGYVGITEQLDASMAGLARHLGIAPPPPGLRANVAADNHTDPSGWFRQSDNVERSRAVEEALMRRTKLDRALYSRVLVSFGRSGAQRQPELVSG